MRATLCHIRLGRVTPFFSSFSLLEDARAAPAEPLLLLPCAQKSPIEMGGVQYPPMEIKCLGRRNCIMRKWSGFVYLRFELDQWIRERLNKKTKSKS